MEDEQKLRKISTLSSDSAMSSHHLEDQVVDLGIQSIVKATEGFLHPTVSYMYFIYKPIITYHRY